MSVAKETNQHPHRRLNVVPEVICKDCVHREHFCGSDFRCLAGPFDVDPVTGSKTHTRHCAEQNANYDCGDFVAKVPKKWNPIGGTVGTLAACSAFGCLLYLFVHAARGHTCEARHHAERLAHMDQTIEDLKAVREDNQVMQGAIEELTKERDAFRARAFELRQELEFARGRR